MKDFAAIVFMVVCIVFAVAASLAPTWVAGSLVTSGVKAVSKDCGKHYGIESILAGDWFCPTK